MNNWFLLLNFTRMRDFVREVNFCQYIVHMLSNTDIIQFYYKGHHQTTAPTTLLLPETSSVTASNSWISSKQSRTRPSSPCPRHQSPHRPRWHPWKKYVYRRDSTPRPPAVAASCPPSGDSLRKPWAHYQNHLLLARLSQPRRLRIRSLQFESLNPCAAWPTP